MKLNRKAKKCVSTLLALALALQYVPVPALAEDGSGLCAHHQEHTAECHYVPASGEVACGHVCGEECAESCVHLEHDADCGYAQAEAGHPCHYECAICTGEEQAESPAPEEPSEDPAPEEPSEDPVPEESSEDPAPEEVVETVCVTVSHTVRADAGYPEDEELFFYYTERELYGYDMATFGTAAADGLNAANRGFYDVLKSGVQRIAAQGGSTVIAVDAVQGLKTTWTNQEASFTDADTTQVQQYFENQLDLDAIVLALLNDCPFDLYWFDKTVNNNVVMSYYVQVFSNGSVFTKAEIIGITCTFRVAGDYKAGDNLVTTDVSRVDRARANALSLVEANQEKTDYEKLLAYKKYICDAASYNFSAASADYTGGYGDPWQLINVFDGEPGTNVVCEGYAKAFQYLCDLGGLDCISTDGDLVDSEGSGRHMWNVVKLDGKKYLVDLTNCDTGAAGEPDLLFLVGGTYANGAYRYTLGGQTVAYECANLGLAESNYQTHTHDYNVEIQGTRIPATCGTPGSVWMQCSCGDKQQQSIPVDKDNHVGGTRIENASAPTCGAAGHTGETICNGCDATLDPGKVIPATGDHKYEAIPSGERVESTCVDHGFEAVQCRVCFVTGKRDLPLNPSNHTGYTYKANAKDATCGADGNKAHTYCLGCDALLTEGAVIPATGKHNFVTEVEGTRVASTCVDKGSVTMQCVCGATEKKDLPLDPANHTGNSKLENYEAPSCLEPGFSGNWMCLDCKQLIEAGIVLDSIGHNFATEVPDTRHYDNCLYPGTVHMKCGCGEYEVQEIPAIGYHTWGEWETVQQPTTMSTGTKVRSCTVCDEDESGIIPVLDRVVIQETQGATVTVDNTFPGHGATVCITVIPDTGKEVQSVTVTDEAGESLPVTRDSETAYTYEQPEGGVVVKVTVHDKTYTVNWMVDTTVYAQTEHTYGETILAPTAPVKEQSGCTVYAFSQWTGFTSGMTMPDNENLSFWAEFTQDESHIDENTDHICDRACGKTGMGIHEDTNSDHKCEYGCNTPIGDHADSAADKDHVCDYGCKEVLEACSDEVKDGDHACDICGKADITDHTYAAATCTAPETCTECRATRGNALGHKDDNKDHICDNKCGIYQGIHADSADDEDHVCDYGCKEVLEACSDEVKDGDHACDICGKADISDHTYEGPTCTAPETCTECSVTRGEALGHKDDNKDHTCDNGCGEYQGTHADSATDKDHVCDYGCKEVLEVCFDQENDGNHACDICGKADISDHIYQGPTCTAPETCTECGATRADALGHKDDNKDHTCDNGCGEYQGTHADSATDTDHVCDYGCKEVLEVCSDRENDGNHACDICGKADITGHTYADATCNTPETCTECSVTRGEALGHKDDNKDHTCDRGCGEYQGTHVDGNQDHKCDYGCSEAIGECKDDNKDHLCDYGCGKSYGEHTDTGKDHACDYGCTEPIGTCEDLNKDHRCDYGCSKVYGEHKDGNLDHACDYGCKETFGTCEDTDHDHDCDYGCKVYHGTHADSADDKDHVCDYGCKEVLEACSDKTGDEDHTCDVCGKEDVTGHDYLDPDCEKPATCRECGATTASALGHVDEDKDHRCDRGCGAACGEHTDTDFDHACDYGCAEAIGECRDEDHDHACDYGCQETFGEHTDSDLDHACDYGCADPIGACADADFDHACDYGCGKSYGEHTDIQGDGDHICDYGCGKRASACEDLDGDAEALCDECGKSTLKTGTQVTFPGTGEAPVPAGTTVEIDGRHAVIDEDGELWLESTDTRILTTYTYTVNASGDAYPTGMQAYYLRWTDEDTDGTMDTCEAVPVPELDNFMTYKGTSIRVGHSSGEGIRFFTAVPTENWNSLVNGQLLTGDLEGYRVLEMGTLYKWAASGTELTTENGVKSYVYGGNVGNTFRVFMSEGAVQWYTGMLTELPSDADILAADVLSRPYVVLVNAEGHQLTLYGGSIQRSVYDVALQNKDYWEQGSAYDLYVENIIATVDAARSEQPTEQPEEGEQA